MLNTGCVRKLLVRLQAAGISADGRTPFSRASTLGRAWPSAKCGQTSFDVARGGFVQRDAQVSAGNSQVGAR